MDLAAEMYIQWVHNAHCGDTVIHLHPGPNPLTLELWMSHFCDAGGCLLSVAVAILRQGNQVVLTARI